MNWSLLVCGRQGHATFAPDEAELRGRLHVDTPAGEAWRCLRCETYVVGPPRMSGPADSAPEVPRGRLLRDRLIMRALAVERAFRAVVLLTLAVLIVRFSGLRADLRTAFDTDLPLLQPLERQLGWDIEHSAVVRLIHDAFSLSETVLFWMAVGLLAYAVLEGIEAVGLWRLERWGEYFAVVATSLFLPLEIYELVERVSVLKLVAFVINIAAVVWLLLSKRLFGLRGGGAAYRAEHETAGLLSVECAAVAARAESGRAAP